MAPWCCDKAGLGLPREPAGRPSNLATYCRLFASDVGLVGDSKVARSSGCGDCIKQTQCLVETVVPLDGVSLRLQTNESSWTDSTETSSQQKGVRLPLTGFVFIPCVCVCVCVSFGSDGPSIR